GDALGRQAGLQVSFEGELDLGLVAVGLDHRFVEADIGERRVHRVGGYTEAEGLAAEILQPVGKRLAVRQVGGGGRHCTEGSDDQGKYETAQAHDLPEPPDATDHGT